MKTCIITLLLLLVAFPLHAAGPGARGNNSYTFDAPRSGYGFTQQTYNGNSFIGHHTGSDEQWRGYRPWVFRRGPTIFFDHGEGQERYKSKHGKGYSNRTIEPQKVPKNLRGVTPPNMTGYDDTHVIITEDAYGELLREGLKYYTIYKIRKAIPYFSRAIEIDPERVDARDYRALCYFKLGMFEYTVIDYLILLQRYPSVRFMHNLGLAYVQLGYGRLGIAWMKRAAARGNSASQKWLVAKGIMD